MIFKQTFETIQNSKIFQKFIKENPDAELVAGFFILDFLSNDTKKSLDYKVEDKIFTFDLNNKNEIIMKEDKLIDNPKFPKLEKINSEIKVEVDEIKSIVGTKALDEGISSKFQKVIAVLQLHEGKQIWNLTCMLEGLIVLHVLIDSEIGEILKFERKNMMDFIKRTK